jgi:hypothetical protein
MTRGPVNFPNYLSGRRNMNLSPRNRSAILALPRRRRHVLLTGRSSRILMPLCTMSFLSCPRSRHPLSHQACIPWAIPWYLPCLGTLYNDQDAGWATGYGRYCPRHTVRAESRPTYPPINRVLGAFSWYSIKLSKFRINNNVQQPKR